MIKKAKLRKDLLQTQEQIDTLYDTMVKERVFAKYPIDKQLSLMMKDHNSDEYKAFEDYVLKVKEDVNKELSE